MQREQGRLLVGLPVGRDFLLHTEEDEKVRRKQEGAQTCQAGCLNLMTNAVVVWSTLYMQEALRQMDAGGDSFDDDRLKHLSPGASSTSTATAGIASTSSARLGARGSGRCARNEYAR